MQSSRFNDDVSIMSSQKLALKITFGDVTKRVRDIPETFEVLKTVVKTTMSKVKGPGAQAIEAGHFVMTYEDDTGDIINVYDDEDLMAAYEVAENCLNR